MNRQPDDLPPDLVAVAADDALLDALNRHECGWDSCCVNEALLAWRREIDAKPIVQLVSVDTALAMMPRRSLLGRLWTRLVTLSRLGKH